MQSVLKYVKVGKVNNTKSMHITRSQMSLLLLLRDLDGMVWYGIVGFNVPIDTL